MKIDVKISFISKFFSGFQKMILSDALIFTHIANINRAGDDVTN